MCGTVWRDTVAFRLLLYPILNKCSKPKLPFELRYYNIPFRISPGVGGGHFQRSSRNPFVFHRAGAHHEAGGHPGLGFSMGTLSIRH